MGLYKRDSGKPSITWPESVDEALCFGWKIAAGGLPANPLVVGDERKEGRNAAPAARPAYRAVCGQSGHRCDEEQQEMKQQRRF